MITALIWIAVIVAWLLMTVFNLGLMRYSFDNDGGAPIVIALTTAPIIFFGALFILLVKYAGPLFWTKVGKKIYDLGKSVGDI